jgi:hypothetical protein
MIILGVPSRGQVNGCLNQTDLKTGLREKNGFYGVQEIVTSYLVIWANHMIAAVGKTFIRFSYDCVISKM